MSVQSWQKLGMKTVSPALLEIVLISESADQYNVSVNLNSVCQQRAADKFSDWCADLTLLLWFQHYYKFMGCVVVHRFNEVETFSDFFGKQQWTVWIIDQQKKITVNVWFYLLCKQGCVEPVLKPKVGNFCFGQVTF